MVWIDRTQRLAHPLGGFEALARDARRFLGELAPPSVPAGFPTNVHVDDSNLVVRMQVPGFGPEHVNVSLEGRRLTLSGELQDGPRFERRFQLPWSVAADQVSAQVEHGLLEVRLPRVEAERPRIIPVLGAAPATEVERIEEGKEQG